MANNLAGSIGGTSKQRDLWEEERGVLSQTQKNQDMQEM